MAKRKAKPQSDTVIMTLDKSGRARRQVKFWLDATKPEQAAMGEALDTMRKDPTKNFAAFMRNAVSLMLSLMTGDMSVLLLLFPGIVQAIEQNACIDIQAANARLQMRNDTLLQSIAQQEQRIADLERQLDNRTLQAQLDRIERLMVNQGDTPMKPVTGGLKPIAGASKTFAAPVWDDDAEPLLEVKKDEGAGLRATHNFLNSLMSLQE